MKWYKNIESFVLKGVVGDCPFCESKNTDYNAAKVTGDMGFAVIWCNDCKHSHIISRLKITDDMKTDNIVPDNLR